MQAKELSNWPRKFGAHQFGAEDRCRLSPLFVAFQADSRDWLERNSFCVHILRAPADGILGAHLRMKQTTPSPKMDPFARVLLICKL